MLDCPHWLEACQLGRRFANENQDEPRFWRWGLLFGRSRWTGKILKVASDVAPINKKINAGMLDLDARLKDMGMVVKEVVTIAGSSSRLSLCLHYKNITNDETVFSGLWKLGRVWSGSVAWSISHNAS